MIDVEALPKLRKKVVKFFTDNPEDVAILTVREIASKLEVNPATVVRACKDMGYEGFEDLKNHRKEIYRKRLVNYDIMLDKLKFESPVQEIIENSFRTDVDILARTINEISWETIANVVDLIANSTRTYIVGLEAASNIANFLALELRTYLPNITEVTVGNGYLFDFIRHLRRTDIVFGISFGSCIRQTVLGLKTAYEQGLTTIAITDSKLSPLFKYSTIPLLTASSSDFYFSAFISAMSIAHGMVNCCAEMKRKESVEQLEKVREQWEEFKLFYEQ